MKSFSAKAGNTPTTAVEILSGETKGGLFLSATVCNITTTDVWVDAAIYRDNDSQLYPICTQFYLPGLAFLPNRRQAEDLGLKKQYLNPGDYLELTAYIDPNQTTPWETSGSPAEWADDTWEASIYDPAAGEYISFNATLQEI